MRTFATIAATLAMSLAAIGLAVAAPGDPASASLRRASGAVGISNSRAGDHILAAGNMRPGEGVSGTVTIGNDGDVAGRFKVAATPPQDTPGAFGGMLSERVELTLSDVTGATPVVIFTGHPADFAEYDVGTFGPGGEREFRFTMTLPQAAGNAYQGSALSLGFVWSAGTVTPTPTATPKPKPKATPTPTATPAPTPVTRSIADVLGLPSAKRCVKRGRLKLKLRAPAGTKIVSASVAVNRKTKRLKGSKVRKPVSLRGLRKKTKITLTVRLSNGRTYKASRTYRACR